MLDALLITPTAQLAAGLICNVLTEISFRGLDRSAKAISEHLRVAAERGQLPINHDVERGIARAHLRACHILVNEIPADLLRDSPPVAGVVPAAWISVKDRAWRDLNGWLVLTIDRLRHDKGAELRRRQSATEVLEGLTSETRALADKAMDRVAGLAVEADGAAQAACKHMIRIGGWTNAHACRLLLEKFIGKAGWAEAFALCFASELKEDERLHRVMLHIKLAELSAAGQESERRVTQRLEALVGVVDGLSARDQQALHDLGKRFEADLAERCAETARKVEAGLELLSERLQVLEILLEELRARASWRNKFLLRPLGQTNPPKNQQLRDLRYTARVDAFVGREKDLEYIRSNLLDEAHDHQKLRWIAVLGEAGVGKSRFAQELVDAYSDRWPIAGFATPDAIKTPDFSREMDIAAPMLIVADYGAAFRASFPDFMEGLVQRAAVEANPVRVVILLRRPNDPVLAELTERSAIHAGGDIAQAQAPEHLVLTKFADETDTLSLMRGRMQRAAAANGAKLVDLSDQQLLRALDNFDQLRRPLFAAIVAEALQRGSLPEHGNERGKEGGEAARFQLFSDMLQEQRRMIWQPVAVEEAGGDRRLAGRMRRRHETIAMLSTLVGGLDMDDFRQLTGERPWTKEARRPDVATSANMLCCNPDGEGPFNEQLLHYILGRESLDGDQITTLEPDLIGECFVLTGLLPPPADVDAEEREFHSCRQKWLLNAAWAVDPEGVHPMARLVTQDYGEAAWKLNLLQPDWE
jgi:hypothetical protein